MKKYLLVGMLLLAQTTFVFSQTIEGCVYSVHKKELEGVNLFSSKRNVHTHTNSKGQFVIKGISKGDSLLISHLSFQNQYIVIADTISFIEVYLKEKPLYLKEVEITHSTKSINILSDIHLKTNPVKSSQEVLRMVPGLFIGQHAGGGKAEQIFLRGFDIDHGTDIHIDVDGLPVNMVSHAHGQGYADMHFIIPETIENIEYGKGPYNSTYGNLATAGYVSLSTKDRLKNSKVSMQSGSFNHKRMMALISLKNTKNQSAYIAGEYISSDGPFESPQNFHRINVMNKYSLNLQNKDRVTLQLSYFQSKWNASGQIPERAIESQQIKRFGAIDDTEGGYTSRTNILLNYFHRIDKSKVIKTRFYYTHYAFDLFSNFTFHLNDSIHGDQIHQSEERNIFGFQSELIHFKSTRKNVEIRTNAAIGLRFDEIDDIQLSHTENRSTLLSYLQKGDITEQNLYAYVNSEIDFGKWLINPSLRLDYFHFEYIDDLESVYQSQYKEAELLSPKLNIIYNPSTKLQFFFKNGFGFHSNDTRVSILKSQSEVLPRVFGSDLGIMVKAHKNLVVHTALWALLSEQEFVYVGDEGIVEPSGQSKRTGIDIGIRWQAIPWVYLHADANYCVARSLDLPSGENFIPLAPDLTTSGGVSIQHPKGFFGGLYFRHMNHRPANDDNSIVAKGYCIVDANFSYPIHNWIIGINIENLMNSEWNETQFATESRLKNESVSVEEIHFTPGTPFTIKGTISLLF